MSMPEITDLEKANFQTCAEAVSGARVAIAFLLQEACEYVTCKNCAWSTRER